MDPLSLVLGLAFGGGVGAILLLLAARKNTSDFNAQLQQARVEFDRLKEKNRTQKQKLAQAEAETKRQVGAAQQQVSGLQQAADAHIKNLEQVQASVRAAEHARDDALEQANSRQTARQQAEAKLRQAEKLATESSQQLRDVEGQLEQARGAHSSLQEAAEQRNEELRRLRADLLAKKDSGAPDESAEVFSDTDGSLQRVLETLLEREGQRTAVLADANGIVIAAAGDRALRDGIAAAGQLLATMDRHLEGMIPFNTVKAFDLRDAEQVVVAGRAFEAAGEVLSLVTYGSRVPSERMLDGAMTSLTTALQ